jgi:hypothetical protein
MRDFLALGDVLPVLSRARQQTADDRYINASSYAAANDSEICHRPILARRNSAYAVAFSLDRQDAAYTVAFSAI